MSVRLTRRFAVRLIGVGAAAVSLALGGTAAAAEAGPGAPENLRVQHVDFTWATVAWDQPAGAGHGFYRAELREAGSPDLIGAPNTVFFATTTSFGGLSQGTDYEATVRRVEGGVESAPVSVEFSTPVFGDAPDAPANLRAVHVDGVLERVEWDAPDGATDLRYRVNSSSPVSPILLFTSRTHFTVAELNPGYPIVDPGSIHTLTVVAIDQGGNASPPSDPLTVTFP